MCVAVRWRVKIECDREECAFMFVAAVLRSFAACFISSSMLLASDGSTGTISTLVTMFCPNSFLMILSANVL